MNALIVTLILSALQTKPDTYANSVDHNEPSENEPSHQELHYLKFYFDFRLISLFASMDMCKFNDGTVQFINSGWKGLSMSTLQRKVYYKPIVTSAQKTIKPLDLFIKKISIVSDTDHKNNLSAVTVRSSICMFVQSALRKYAYSSILKILRPKKR